MRYREPARKLRRLGCELDRRARGAHEFRVHPSTRGKTTIPNWGGRDLKRDTFHAILRDLGVTRDEFDRA